MTADLRDSAGRLFQFQYYNPLLSEMKQTPKIIVPWLPQRFHECKHNAWILTYTSNIYSGV